MPSLDILCRMAVPINGVYEVSAVATGKDGEGNSVQLELIAYVLDAGDAGVAVDAVESALLSEPVIPDGAGGFSNPDQVAGVAVAPSDVFPVSPLIYRHLSTGANVKFTVTNIHEILVFASMAFEGPITTTLNVYPLNRTLSQAIAVAKSEVMTMKILPDPEVPGQFDTPDTVIAISGKAVAIAPAAGLVL